MLSSRFSSETSPDAGTPIDPGMEGAGVPARDGVPWRRGFGEFIPARLLSAVENASGLGCGRGGAVVPAAGAGAAAAAGGGAAAATFGFGGASLRAANTSARVTMSFARWRNQEALPRDWI